MGSEETHEGTRRRRPRLAIAAVAAAVLLAGGGGAYLATNASGGGTADAGAPTADDTPPPLVLDDTARGVAPGEPAPGGVRYRAGGELPDGPDSASVYRLRGEVTAAQVTRLAEALDVSGTPRAEGTEWKVGRAGDGPVLTVGKEAPGSWTFQAHSAGADNCPQGKRCGAVGSSGPDGAGPGPVSEQAAERAAAPVLKAVGQGAADLDASQTMGAVRVVNADPEVGGLPTYGWSTGVQVGSDGQVVGGSGKLTKPVEGATYPVLGAEKTIGLLNASASGDGRGGSDGCARPVPHAQDDRGEGDRGAAPGGGRSGIAPGEPQPGGPRQPCPPESGAPKPAPVEVAEATFGLALHFERGRQVLVPSWLFEVRPEGTERPFTLTHPAVDPAYLTGPSTPAPEPTDEPESPAPPESRDVPVTSYSADGRTLTLRFWGGACSDYTARATESATQVRVAVTEKPQKKGQVCIMIAEEHTERVTLDEPLGDREVVGTDGVAVRRG